MTKTINEEMRRSYLVQRLNRPHGTEWQQKVGEVFSFGGGMRNGGLSEAAMGLLRQVFSFDYMGSAEFEWGAVPKALEGLAKANRKDLTAFSFSIPLAKVKPNWHQRKQPAPDGDGTVYVLCRAAHSAEVQDRIIGWATGEEALKEFTRLLDNGFFFFTDRDMWARTAALFGVEVSA